jgi:hypothetical protein
LTSRGASQNILRGMVRIAGSAPVQTKLKFAGVVLKLQTADVDPSNCHTLTGFRPKV